MKRDQRGAIDIFIILFILVFLLLVGAAAFGFWAYGGRQDYKNNVDQKISAAVDTAVAQTQAADKKQYDEDAKKPLATYTGPEAYGSIVVKYPKTWSAYVSTSSNNSGAPVDGYFYPSVVPSISDSTNAFALRLQVQTQPYDQILQSYSGKAKDGKVTITPYSLPQLSSVVGVRIDGEIESDKQGSMVILPLRTDTILLWTEASQFEDDFNNNILPNFSFSP